MIYFAVVVSKNYCYRAVTAKKKVENGNRIHSWALKYELSKCSLWVLGKHLHWKPQENSYMTWTFRTSYHYYFILYKNYIFLDRERQHAILSPLLPQFLRRRDANLIWTAVDILTSGIIKTSGSTTQYLTKVSSLHLCCRKAMSLFLNLYRKWFTKKM